MSLFYDIKYWFSKKINRTIDILEYGIVTFARSKFLYKIKRIIFYINFYMTVEGQLKNEIEMKKVSIRKVTWKYRYYWKYYIYNSNFLISIRYIYKMVWKAPDKKNKIYEIYIYLKKVIHILNIYRPYYKIMIYYKVKFIYNIWKLDYKDNNTGINLLYIYYMVNYYLYTGIIKLYNIFLALYLY